MIAGLARWSSRRALGLLGLALGLASACFQGEFLAGQACVDDRDCGPALTCEAGICGGYTCPVAEVGGVCPCAGPQTFACTELDQTQTRVDVLFVVDDTSVASQTAALELVPGLLERLDANLVDYRVAVTTTDAGNPECASAPEAGALVLSSCRERLADFELGAEDARPLCLDRCALAELSTVALASEAEPRPWIVGGPGPSNLPAGVSAREALDCVLPQGVAGCGFEQPLESLHAALDRAEDPLDPSFGFVRPDAHLLVVIVTDEGDCSHNPAAADIFSPDGDKQFWSDPSAAAPSSAVCWNAGVACSGDPSGYDDCQPADLGPDGAPTADPDAAVLRPVDRYVERVRSLAASKRAVADELAVVVAVVAGVDPEDRNVVHYASDPAFDGEYGIGPGCASAAGFTAQPPARLFALIERLDDGYSDVYSICEAGVAAAVSEFDDDLIELAPAQCAPTCVADKLLATPGVQPDCALAHVVDGERRDIPACPVDVDGQPGLGEDPVCFFTRSGESLSPTCRARGTNLQFGFVTAPGVPVPEPIYASCERSADPLAECGPS